VMKGRTFVPNACYVNHATDGPAERIHWSADVPGRCWRFDPGWENEHNYNFEGLVGDLSSLRLCPCLCLWCGALAADATRSGSQVG
jgi:hypothetical protein